MSNFDELQFVNPTEKNRHVYHLLSAYYQPSKYTNKNDLIEILFKKYSIKCAVQYYPLYKYALFKRWGKVVKNFLTQKNFIII